jgi:hypothetical protein
VCTELPFNCRIASRICGPVQLHQLAPKIEHDFMERAQVAAATVQLAYEVNKALPASSSRTV